METDDTGGPPLAVQVLAPPAFNPPPPPVEQPPVANPRRTLSVLVWIVAIVAVLALAAAAVLAVMYRDVSDQKDAANAARDRTRAQLSDETARVAQLESQVSDLEASVEAGHEEASQLQADLDDANQRIEDGEAAAETVAAETREVTVASAVSWLLNFGYEEGDAECMAELGYTQDGVQLTGTLSRLLDPDADWDEVFETVDELADGCDAADPPPAVEPEAGLTYGDNPVLDSLWDACANGSGSACDDLYNRSEPGTEYERFALTCGDRFEEVDAPLYCDGAF